MGRVIHVSGRNGRGDISIESDDPSEGVQEDAGDSILDLEDDAQLDHSDDQAEYDAAEFAGDDSIDIDDANHDTGDIGAEAFNLLFGLEDGEDIGEDGSDAGSDDGDDDLGAGEVTESEGETVIETDDGTTVTIESGDDGDSSSDAGSDDSGDDAGSDEGETSEESFFNAIFGLEDGEDVGGDDGHASDDSVTSEDMGDGDGDDDLGAGEVTESEGETVIETDDGTTVTIENGDSGDSSSDDAGSDDSGDEGGSDEGESSAESFSIFNALGL